MYNLPASISTSSWLTLCDTHRNLKKSSAEDGGFTQIIEEASPQNSIELNEPRRLVSE